MFTTSRNLLMKSFRLNFGRHVFCDSSLNWEYRLSFGSLWSSWLFKWSAYLRLGWTSISYMWEGLNFSRTNLFVTNWHLVFCAGFTSYRCEDFRHPICISSKLLRRTGGWTAIHCICSFYGEVFVDTDSLPQPAKALETFDVRVSRSVSSLLVSIGNEILEFVYLGLYPVIYLHVMRSRSGYITSVKSFAPYVTLYYHWLSKSIFFQHHTCTVHTPHKPFLSSCLHYLNPFGDFFCSISGKTL